MRSSKPTSRRWLKRVLPIVETAILLIFVLIYLYPIIWQVTTAFKTQSDALAMPPKWIFTPTFENFANVLFERQMGRFFLNSVIIAVGSSVLAVIIGAMAAYALGRFQFKGKRDIAFWILSTRMAPPVAVIIPIFILYRNYLKLYNTYFGMILIYLVFNLPFAVWMLRGFFAEIPRDIEDAALVDGCSRWQAFWRVLLPMVAPGLAATAIFCIIVSWNEFLFALILTADKTKTLPVAITTFVSGMEIQWGELTASGTVVMIPLLIFALAVQRHLVRGLTLGAVKD